jgi:hypothetical protein
MARRPRAVGTKAPLQRLYRHSRLYGCGIVHLTPTGLATLLNEPRHQIRKVEQVRHAEARTAAAEHDLRVGRDVVRPVHRYRADAIRVDAQQEPRTVPVVPLPHADELPSAERVERVHDAHKTRGCERRACILS